MTDFLLQLFIQNIDFLILFRDFKGCIDIPALITGHRFLQHIDEDGFTVRTKEKNEKIIVQPEEWTNSKYVLNEETKEITEEQEGVFKQYPVKLAWGITIHKSQGLTFEHAIIDARSAFAHGQAYVALSRCKTLEGMVLSSPLSVNAIINDTIIDDYNQYIETHTPNEELLHAMQQTYFLNLVSELFDFSPIARSFN